MGYRCYVAGPWMHRDEVRVVAQKVRDAGYTVDCRWLDVHDDVALDDPNREAFLRAQALADIEDILASDAFIYVNSMMSEGKAVELGMAIATLKPIIIIGDRNNNIFLSLSMPAFPTVEEALVWMKEER